MSDKTYRSVLLNQYFVSDTTYCSVLLNQYFVNDKTYWSLLFNQYFVSVKINKNEMGGLCSTYGGGVRRVQEFGGET